MTSHWAADTIRIVGHRAAQYPELGRWKYQDNEGLVFIRFPGGDGAWFAPEECVDLRDAIVDALRKLPEDTTWGIPVRDGGTSNTLVSVLDEFAPSSPEVVAAFSEGAPALVDVFAVFDRLADFQPPSKEAIDAFALRALDMACARALGTHIRPEDIEANNHRRVFPPYSSDPAAARVLEDEVKRSGLAHEYAVALYGIVTHHYLTHEGATPDEIVLLVFATPEQRARAFLEVAKKND